MSKDAWHRPKKRPKGPTEASRGTTLFLGRAPPAVGWGRRILSYIKIHLVADFTSFLLVVCVSQISHHRPRVSPAGTGLARHLDRTLRDPASSVTREEWISGDANCHLWSGGEQGHAMSRISMRIHVWISMYTLWTY